MDQIECESLPNSKALRDAIICIGWLKLASVLWYMMLFFLTTAKSRGEMSNVLRDMLLAAAPLQVAHALLLFYGALEVSNKSRGEMSSMLRNMLLAAHALLLFYGAPDGRMLAVEMSLWLCLALGAYNLVLGLVGCVYFIRIGEEDMHFVLAALYVMITLSVFTVLCHDVLVVYAFKQVLLCSGKMCPGAD